MSDVTSILNAIEHGDAKSGDKLLPLVYEELRLLAAQELSQEKPGQTLQATALVHETYIGLVEGGDQSWNSRGHFFNAAAEAMRRILVDNARRKGSIKYCGGLKKVNLNHAFSSIEEPRDDILALNKALDKLADEDQQLAELVELRYLSSLTLGQIAKIVGVTRRTANRHWALGRAWLYRKYRLIRRFSRGDGQQNTAEWELNRLYQRRVPTPSSAETIIATGGGDK
jgi:RNA polymerase sigma factor (TIGR02999 family)